MLLSPISDQVFVVINNQWRGRGGRHIRTNTEVYIYKYKRIHLQIQSSLSTIRVEGGMGDIFIGHKFSAKGNTNLNNMKIK